MPPIENPEKRHKVTRRQALRRIASVGVPLLIDPRGVVNNLLRPREVLQTPEMELWAPERAGMNFHFLKDGQTDSTEQSVVDFRNNVDFLLQAGIKNIRFDIPPWIIMQRGDTPNDTTWKDKKDGGLDHVKQTLQHAKEKGMKLQTMVALPDIPDIWSEEDILTMTDMQFGKVASELVGLVDAYQIGNEFNSHNVRKYNDNTFIEADTPQFRAYADLAAKVITTANNAIKAKDHQALTAVNMSYWVKPDDSFYARFDRFFQSIDKNSFDLFGLNYYPDKNFDDISQLSAYIKYLRDKTGKQVYISEFGLPTFKDFTEFDQQQVINAIINQLKIGGIQPTTAFIYQLYNKPNPNPDIDQDNYGVLNADGTQKQGWDSIKENLTTTREEYLYVPSP